MRKIIFVLIGVLFASSCCSASPTEVKLYKYDEAGEKVYVKSVFVEINQDPEIQLSQSWTRQTLNFFAGNKDPATGVKIASMSPNVRAIILEPKIIGNTTVFDAKFATMAEQAIVTIQVEAEGYTGSFDLTQKISNRPPWLANNRIGTVSGSYTVSINKGSYADLSYGDSPYQKIEKGISDAFNYNLSEQQLNMSGWIALWGKALGDYSASGQFTMSQSGSMQQIGQIAYGEKNSTGHIPSKIYAVKTISPEGKIEAVFGGDLLSNACRSYFGSETVSSPILEKPISAQIKGSVKGQVTGKDSNHFVDLMESQPADTLLNLREESVSSGYSQIENAYSGSLHISGSHTVREPEMRPLPSMTAMSGSLNGNTAIAVLAYEPRLASASE